MIKDNIIVENISYTEKNKNLWKNKSIISKRTANILNEHFPLCLINATRAKYFIHKIISPINKMEKLTGPLEKPLEIRFSGRKSSRQSSSPLEN